MPSQEGKILYCVRSLGAGLRAVQRAVGCTILCQTGISLYWSESLQRASEDPVTALAGTGGSAILEGGSAGYPPGTRVSKILFLPCSPELAVVDTVPPGVPHSLGVALHGH